MRFMVILAVTGIALVVAAFLLWPSIKDQLISPENPIVETPEPASEKIEKAEPAPIKTLESSVKSPAPTVHKTPRIYRWTDENGKEVYSDKPGHESAVAYDADEMGYITLPDDSRQEDSTGPQAKFRSARESAVENPGSVKVSSEKNVTE